MTVFTQKSVNQKGDYNMTYAKMPHRHPVHHPMHPVPPHERAKMLRISLDEKDREALLTVFGDQDSATSAEQIIYDAPSEVQILAIQALRMVAQSRPLPQSSPEQENNENSQAEAPTETLENRVRWSCPVLDESVGKSFLQTYGEIGYSFCAVLGTAPYEIAVIARILAYLNGKAGTYNGHY